MEKLEDHVYYNALFDIYGNLLNEREKEIFTLSYVEDLSLQEIADIKNVSKTAIGNALTIINKKLNHYEETLKFYKKIENVEKLINQITNEELKEKIKKALE